MKRMVLSAILAMGIHACLLWSDFGGMGKPSAPKPRPKFITLELVSRQAPEAAPKPVKSAPPPTLAPATEQMPKQKPIPKPPPLQRPKPKSMPEPIPEIKTEPPLPLEPDPPLSAPQIDPIPDSAAETTPSNEVPQAPASLPEAAPPPSDLWQADNTDQTGPPEPVRAAPAPVIIREAKPRYRDKPRPTYPLLARKRGYQGIVVLDVFIDKNGRVGDVKVFSSSGYAILDRAARATVESWLFEPGMKGEEKIDMWVKVPIRFQLK